MDGKNYARRILKSLCKFLARRICAIGGHIYPELVEQHRRKIRVLDYITLGNHGPVIHGPKYPAHEITGKWRCKSCGVVYVGTHVRSV